MNKLASLKKKPGEVSITIFKQFVGFKGAYLDFAHLTELKYIYITETYMKKQYKSSINSYQES